MLILVVPFFVTYFRIGGVSGTGLSLTGCDDVCGVAKEPKATLSQLSSLPPELPEEEEDEEEGELAPVGSESGSPASSSSVLLFFLRTFFSSSEARQIVVKLQ